MTELTDYHMHSILSDGKDGYEEMIKAAVAKGFREIGFSDHLCLKPTRWAVSEVDIPVMTEQILELKAKYESSISIKYGVEVDYFPEMESEIYHQIKALPVDYVIGSVHFIGDWNFDTDQSLYGKWSNDRLYEMYFERLQMAARSSLFDIIGHLDLIKKFQVYPESDQTDLIKKTLEIIRDSKLVVELNTSGLDRPCADFLPSGSIIAQCYHHHIPVILSSDAHSKSQIGRHFNSGLSLLKKTGFTQLVRFNQRRRSFVPL